MKKFTSIAVCVSLAASTAVAATSPKSLGAEFNRMASAVRAKKVGNLLTKATPGKADQSKLWKTRASNAGSLWRSKTQKSFGWWDEEWILDETYTMDYDNAGNITTQSCVDMEGFVTRQQNTWNENNLLATRLTTVAESEDDEFENSSKLEREYDPIVTSFITSNKQDIWMDGDWNPSNCYTQTVTRNSDGNVTEVVRAVLFNGIYDPINRLVIEYGSDGKPVAITEYDLTYDYATSEYAWECSLSMTDIEWESCNGQIVSADADIFSGENRMKKYTMEQDDETMLVVVEYDGDDFTATATATEEEDGMVMSIVSTLSHKNLVFSGDEGAHGEHGYVEETDMVLSVPMLGYEESMKTIETCIYDGNDLIVLEKAESEYDGETYIDDMLEGEIEYDAEEGYPLQWTLKTFNPDTEESEYAFRAEYSDYVNLGSGVSGIAPDATEVRYFDLTGNRISNPTKGLYIRVAGNKADKVIL